MGVLLFITSVQVPSSAAAGTVVDVKVTVGNPGPTVFTYAAVTGVYNAVEFPFSPVYHELPPDTSKSFIGQFVMPSRDVSITVYAFYWASNKWNGPDDQQTVIVKLGEGAPSGRMTRKYIKHDGSALQDIPAGDIPLNDSTQIHVYCEHDHPSVKRLGVDWVIKDPDGHVADRYDAEDNVAAQKEKHFYDYSGPRLTKAGIYTIDIKFYVEGTLVDSYSGTLCTVPGGAIGDGDIVSKKVRHGRGVILEHTDNIPAFGVEMGELFRLEIKFRNTGELSMDFGLHWIIEKPSGMLIEGTVVEMFKTSPGATETFIEPRIIPYHVDEVGVWKLKKLVLFGETGAVLDSWSGNLFTVVEVAEGEGEIISKAILHGMGLVPTKTATIPASNIEKGERFKLKIGFKNTGTTSMRFGLHWVIEKPGGDTIEGTAIELISTSAGATETFLEPTVIPYLIDEEGTWRLTKLELLSDDGSVLDAWSGVLLTAVAPTNGDDNGVIGQLSRVWINWSSYTYLTPPAEVTNKGTFEVYGEAKNISSINRKFGVKVTAIKPSGAIVSPDIDYEAGWTGPGGTQPFGFNMGPVDELGVWAATVELYEYEGELLDQWSGDLFTVGEAPAGIIDAIPALIGVMVMMMIMPLMGEIE